MKLAKYIDHTLLAADATEDRVDKTIAEAIQYDFASVCINPYWVKHTAAGLKDSDVNTCTVIGFPLGATSTESKVFEAQQAIKDGADELDMVINIGELKANHNDAVKADIKALADAVHAEGKLLKVIIETSLLDHDEKVRACELSESAGADFVKTSTGFSTAGAKVEDVKLMRETVGDRLGVKASGGVHSKAEAEAMIAAGATRIGASAKIVTE
ncbi:deoxyribose-phosphate aldolase [Secundilactobacillus paracollinoides]|uniref:Deoxyribose-phosphate aldolase n=1 Tax=Secundilactobacillus paracollinoides TaxID=240427 RepID=A0A1B2IUW1_9LACO|nr:deoxyribose-phosphate aldolase [Secundilactobacillus paracollinoides]ANZ60052.1 2-deoxyribose-5-phosphate aldolase [Secundilactobacillus paracollinoides]ANZ65845.1 2-deoxyribose-5-phosphate aldolase [Secundilactobacillus paracollinoides]